MAMAVRSRPAIASALDDDSASTFVATLFLDQIGDLPFKLQRRLSHLLDDHDAGKRKDQQQEPVRIICASARNLRREVREGRFRRDLFDHLAVVTIEVPALRERPEDLPEVCEYLRQRYRARFGVGDRVFPPDLLARMLNYTWPGNFCELENFVRRFVTPGCDHWNFREKDGLVECHCDALDVLSGSDIDRKSDRKS
jgi:DNA-binding NtrC family response regulator